MQAFTPGDLPELAPHPGYRLVLPDHPRPIVLIGAGGIVRDAHLPAYAKAGFTVASITDLDRSRAQTLADAYGIAETYDSVADAVAHAPADAVYDVALPPEAHVAVLEALPDGAAVLLQKPLGNDLAAGTRTGLSILDGWRFEQFGRDALDLVEGRLAFAVVNGKLKMTLTEDEA